MNELRLRAAWAFLLSTAILPAGCTHGRAVHAQQPATAPAASVPAAAGAGEVTLKRDGDPGRDERVRDVLATSEEHSNRGADDEALALLRQHLASHPQDHEVRLRAAELLTATGADEETDQLLEGGLQGGPDDATLLYALAQHATEWAERGPGVSYERGMVLAKPHGMTETQVAEWKKQKLLEAKRHLERCVQLGPEREAPASRLAELLGRLGQHADARAHWDELRRRKPNVATYHYFYAQASATLGERKQALEALERVVALAPYTPAAYERIAQLLDAEGDAERARGAREQAAFYRFFPAPLRIRYEPRRAEQVRVLDGHFGEAGDAKRLEGELALLASDASSEAEAILAAFVWHHSHDRYEDRAFASLASRGTSANRTLYTLVDEAQSVCTRREAFAALTAHPDDRTFDVLIAALPHDTQPAHPMMVAEALVKLGDARAVPHLLAQLKRNVPEESVMAMSVQNARGRAALALSHFESPEIDEALRAVLGEESLRPFAAAALYRRTLDPRFLKQLSKDFESHSYDMLFIVPSLGDLKRPEVSALERAYRAYQKAHP